MVKHLLLLALFCGALRTSAQSVEVFDSLQLLYESGSFHDSSELSILQNLSFHASNPDTSLFFAQRYLSKAKTSRHKSFACYHIGNAYRLKADYSKAARFYLKSLSLADNFNKPSHVANVRSALGDVYSLTGSHENAVRFYKLAIDMLRVCEDSISLSSVILNLGDEYFQNHELDSSLICFNEAAVIFENLNYKPGIAYNLGNIGLVRAEQGNAEMAEKNIQEAVSILEQLEDFYGISVYLTYMADIYEGKNEIPAALKYASRSLQLAIKYGLKEQIRNASLKLSELYEIQGNIDSAYHYHKEYVAFRDSINNEEAIQKIADLRTEYEVGQKQAEVNVLTAQQRTERVIMAAIALLAVVLLILGLIVYKYYKQKSRTSRELERLNQTKDKFFSIISHDLRGPVSSFMGISRMIKFLVEAKETDQLLEIADDIDDSVERLSSLLDNLLNWAMQQQGHFPNVPEKVSLNEMADELAKTLKNMAQGKLIDLDVDISESIDLWVDRNTTMTILRNLVNNALKFTSKGGQVVVKAMQQGEQAIIEVQDTGVGMPSEKLNSLFKLQDKKSTYGTAGEKGLGLGLQLVYEFIEMNNGSIDVSSVEGKGTTFKICLPLFSYSDQLVES